MSSGTRKESEGRACDHANGYSPLSQRMNCPFHTQRLSLKRLMNGHALIQLAKGTACVSFRTRGFVRSRSESKEASDVGGSPASSQEAGWGGQPGM